MTGKHYQWWKRWQVDLSACTATHDSGLIVKFAQAENQPDVRNGEAENSEIWFEKMQSAMPAGDLAKHAARLLREAGDAYLWQLKKRH